MACEKCGGSGWIIVEREGVSGAERCDCRPEVRAAHDLEAAANIPPLYRDASFDNFVLPRDNPIANEQLGRVLLETKKYVREYPFGVRKPGLMFLGPTGTGKTHLAVAVLRTLAAKGFEGRFYDYADLIQQIRAGFDPESGEEGVFQSCLEVPVLLIDDLGSHRVLDWIEDTVTAIVTRRCNHQRTLLITSNLPDPDAGDQVREKDPLTQQWHSRFTLGERIGERARSRLFEMCKLIRMPMIADYRLSR
jgi:DNA replication protein DnaC